jgi:hypothetical protein
MVRMATTESHAKVDVTLLGIGCGSLYRSQSRLPNLTPRGPFAKSLGSCRVIAWGFSKGGSHLSHRSGYSECVMQGGTDLIMLIHTCQLDHHSVQGTLVSLEQHILPVLPHNLPSSRSLLKSLKFLRHPGGRGPWPVLIFVSVQEIEIQS